MEPCYPAGMNSENQYNELVAQLRREMASAGGKARMAKLGKPGRAELARAAARARWGTPKPLKTKGK